MVGDGQFGLSITDFNGAVGTALDEKLAVAIEAADWRYQRLTGDQRDAVILQCLKRLETGDFSIAREGDQARWHAGWRENLDAFVSSHGDASALVPKYFRRGVPLRIYQNFAIPTDPEFEINFVRFFRTALFQRYLSEFSTIYEFGCGSGFNVGLLARLFPEADIVGLDWVPESAAIIDQMRQLNHSRVSGHVFDFFKPDYGFKIDEGSAVITVGALEQVGDRFEPFIEYLLQGKPALVLHIEPIMEWYDPENLIDYTALMLHQRRNFLRGLLPSLRAREKSGLIEIIEARRVPFGSTLVEANSVIAWRLKS